MYSQLIYELFNSSLVVIVTAEFALRNSSFTSSYGLVAKVVSTSFCTKVRVIHSRGDGVIEVGDGNNFFKVDFFGRWMFAIFKRWVFLQGGCLQFF